MAHWVGGGIDAVLDMTTDDFENYFTAALDLYQKESTRPRRVVLLGMERQ